MTLSEPQRSRLRRPWIGFTLSLLIPSTAVIQKTFGVAGVAVYLVLAALAVLLLHRYWNDLFLLAAKATEKQALWLAGFTFFLIWVAFLLVFPIANSGAAGRGSDSDDALNVGVRELLHGRYPYYSQTYLGNPISPLPGALLLAIPFVLLGSSAYQNFFWLPVFFFTMRSLLKDGRLALLMLWGILIISPVVLYQIFIGSDYIANSIYVLVFMLWMESAISRPEGGGGQKALLAVLLGIGLSSRLNFWLVMPLLFSALAQKAGWNSAIKYTGVTFVAFFAVTLPFYLYDSQGFTPLQTADELGKFQSILPYAGFAIPLAAGLLAVILAFLQSTHGNMYVLLRNCTLALAFPVLCGMLLSSLKSGKIDFGFALFGSFFLFFGAAGFWPSLVEKTA